MSKIAVTVIGAGGKMGTRTSNNLAKFPEEIELYLCESGEKGIQAVLDRGMTPSKPEDVVPLVDVVIFAVPDSLIESARIDGCSEIRIFHKIVFPIIKPAVFTQAIFVFVNSWNNFINPLILIFTPEKLPLPVVIQQLNGTYMRDYGVVYLGVSISVIPIVIFASLFLKRIIGGVTVGAVKG